MPKVGIVISNYNGWQDTLVCLDSLQKQTFTDFEVILIDDASPNDSVAQLQNKLPPNTVFLPQERNVGFAAANNIGMRRALDDGCDFALLLNNDTSVRPDFLEKLLAETPAGAVSCPKMLFMDPPDEIWFAGGELDPKTGKVKHLGGHKKDGPEFAEKKQVSFITFCCVLLPRAVIEKVGYLDETLFCTARTLTTAFVWRRPACRCGFCPMLSSTTRRVAARAGCCRSTTSPATRCT